MIKPAYSVSFLLSINIFVWQNVLYFLDAPRIIVCIHGHQLLIGQNVMLPNTTNTENIPIMETGHE